MRSFPSLYSGSGDKGKDWLIRSIWLSTLAVLLGRGWQHIFLDAPYRALLWDESWMGRLVRILGWDSWDSYITSSGADHGIDQMIVWIGVILLLTFVITLFWRICPHWMRQIFWSFSWIVLVLLAFFYCKEKFYAVGQFFEYSLQFGSVFLLWSVFRHRWNSKYFVLIVKAAIALTFICHGLYAVGYYPRPGHFVEMCINFFGMSESAATGFLWGAGILDFVAAILIFVPIRLVSNIGLGYCVIWGAMTAFARVAASYYGQDITEVLVTELPGTIYRLPHFLVPLGLLLWQWRRDD